MDHGQGLRPLPCEDKVMKLKDAQWKFLKDFGDLIAFIEHKGFSATGGELLRTIEQQRIYVNTGASKTMNSRHIQKLAIDLAIFSPEGVWLQDKKGLQMFGDYWEGLDKANSWGGNWKSFLDTPHFERKPPTRGEA